MIFFRLATFFYNLFGQKSEFGIPILGCFDFYFNKFCHCVTSSMSPQRSSMSPQRSSSRPIFLVRLIAPSLPPRI